MGRTAKLIRTLFFIIILFIFIAIINVRGDNEAKEETPIEIVERINAFHTSSGYDSEDKYIADRVILQKHKQIALDLLTYKETIQYVAIQNNELSGKIDNIWLSLIDNTLFLIDEGLKTVNRPEYIKIDQIMREKNFKSLLE